MTKVFILRCMDIFAHEGDDGVIDVYASESDASEEAKRLNSLLGSRYHYYIDEREVK